MGEHTRHNETQDQGQTEESEPKELQLQVRRSTGMAASIFQDIQLKQYQ